MGFKLSKLNTASDKPFEITIPLSVNITYDDDGEEATPDYIEVRHIMRMPTTTEREKHQQMLVKVRGQNIKAQGSTEANFWIWKQCYLRLEGYEDLPVTREQVIKLFDDSPVLHIHAENAAQALLGYINANEGEITKK
jgi:hypothetical protein